MARIPAPATIDRLHPTGHTAGTAEHAGRAQALAAELEMARVERLAGALLD
jgi:hypothetical protein